ncbi:MAG: glycosyltransferase [Ilumatobacteraceae bacterium]
MIRVSHIITRTNIGGPSVIVASLLGDTNHPDVEQSLVRGGTSSEEGDYFADSPLMAKIETVSALGRRVRPWDDVRVLFALVKHLRSTRPDVVHTHMAKAGALGRMAAFLARVPIRVHTYHGHLLSGYFGPTVTKAIVLVERLLQLVTTHTVVVGHQVRRDLIDAKVIKESTSQVINPGVERLDLVESRRARTELGLPADGVIVAYIGRFASIKRPDRFVNLARRMSNRADVHFVMVGDGPLLADTRHSSGDLSNVHFLPWQRQLGVILGAVDVVVMCSDNEGVPLLLIEAGLANKPVVSTRVGSVGDVVEDSVTGLLVEREDHEALRHAVELLVDDAALRERMGLAGHQRGVERFTTDIAVSAHAEMYRRLATDARGGRSARRPR